MLSKFNPLNTDTFYGPVRVSISGLWLYFSFSPFDIAYEELLDIQSSSGFVLTTWSHLQFLISLRVYACLPSVTPWPTITSICKSLLGKQCRSCCLIPGRGVASTIFTLICRATFLSSRLHCGRKKVISTSGHLANWRLTLCLWWKAPLVLIPIQKTKYSRTLLDGHPLNTDTSSLRPIFFVPGESPYIFSKFNPLNTDTR